MVGCSSSHTISLTCSDTLAPSLYRIISRSESLSPSSKVVICVVRYTHSGQIQPGNEGREDAGSGGVLATSIEITPKEGGEVLVLFTNLREMVLQLCHCIQPLAISPSCGKVDTSVD